jgi:protein-disulfide isomerase
MRTDAAARVVGVSAEPVNRPRFCRVVRWPFDARDLPTRIHLIAWLLGVGALFLAPHLYAQDSRTVPPAVLAAVLKAPLATPPVGAKNGGVTIVEYFDYNCPVCRALEPQIRQLLADDPQVRLVRKDFPIFGAASEYAAYCSFAASNEAQYQTIHDALIGAPRNLESKADVIAVLKAAGLNVARIASDVDLHESEFHDRLARSIREAQQLGIRGTPGIIVGKQLLAGRVDYARLQQLIGQIRRGSRSD